MEEESGEGTSHLFLKGKRCSKKVMLANFYLFFTLISFPEQSTKILKLPP